MSFYLSTGLKMTTIVHHFSIKNGFISMFNYCLLSITLHYISTPVRVSDGLVAMFKQPINSTIPLALFDIENGERLVRVYLKKRKKNATLEPDI